MTLGIYGTGGLGREVFAMANTILDPQWDEIIFIDDRSNVSPRDGITVLSFDAVKAQYKTNEIKIAIGVGEPFAREKLGNRVLAEGYSLQTLIHPQTEVAPTAEIAEGAIINFGCLVSCEANIGSNAYLQPSSLVGHDSSVGDHSVISSFVAIAGNCSIGSCTYIGMSVPVKEGIRIGSGTIIGMGSVVSRDIEDNVIALGNPARPMKKNDEQRVFK